MRKNKNMRKHKRMLNNSLSCLGNINETNIENKDGNCCPGHKLVPITVSRVVSEARNKVLLINNEYFKCTKCNMVYAVK